MEKETVPGDSGSAMLQSKGEEETKMTVSKEKMKVMVAIDDSAESFNALKWALDNLYGIVNSTPEDGGDGGGGGGILTIVHVQQPFQRFVLPTPSTSTAFYATSSMVESVRKSQEENSAALLSRALQMCKDKMVKAESLVLEGDPKDMICQSAEQMLIDLLVVGSRGLGKIKRAFLGSVSDYCAHHAACPIIIVKPPKEQHE